MSDQKPGLRQESRSHRQGAVRGARLVVAAGPLARIKPSARGECGAKAMKLTIPTRSVVLMPRSTAFRALFGIVPQPALRRARALHDALDWEFVR